MIAWSLSLRPLVLFLTLLVALYGALSLAQLPIDAVPDVTNVQVQINTEAEARSPLEVESQITFPIEQSLAGLPGVEQVRSLSKYGLSQVTVVFQDRVDLFFARQLVLERLQEARGQIPEGMGDPEMAPISTGLGEIYQYEVRAPGLDLMERRSLQDFVVKRQLRNLRGVAEVNSFGGLEAQFQVLAHPARLQARGLTLTDLFQALEKNNLNAAGGYLEYRGEQYVVRGLGRIQSLQDVRDIVLTESGGVPVRVGDVAIVEMGPALRQGAVTRDGQGEIVTGIAMMLVGENSRNVARRLHKRSAEMEPSLPAGATLDAFYDRTELVDRTLATVARNLLEGAVLVILVLFFTLGDMRAALIVALAIPLSMLFAAILMVKTGISGNLMSLGAIDFGLIVDGSVVMVENAVRRLRQHEGTVLQACQEVARPVVTGVGIIILVYLPLLTLTGMEGKMFVPMAATVVFALSGSLLLALTTVPVLASYWLKRGGPERDSRLVELARRAYRPALTWALARPGQLVLVAATLFLLSLVTLSRMGAEFLPELDEGAIAIQASRLPSTSLTQSIEMVTRLEQAIKEFPEVKTVVSKTGRPDIATDPMGVEVSDIIITLNPQHGDKNALVEKMEQRLKEVPGMNYSFSQPIELRVSELISGVRSDVGLKIFGEDLDVLKATAAKVAARLGEIEGAADIQVEQVSGLPYLQIEFDRQAMARHGLSAADLADVVELAVGERPAGTVMLGDRRYPLVVRLQAPYRSDPTAIGAIAVPLPRGGQVPLSDLASIRIEPGLAQVSRENGQRRIVVEANVRGRDMVSFVDEARAAVQPLLPEGYFLDFGGQFENYRRARNRLLVVVPVSLAMIYFLLYASLRSARQSGLIFLNVPFAITGGVAALAGRGLPFSISAGVGFIALFGIAVLNGLVLINALNLLRAQGRGLDEAVEEGSLSRLRPVMMTALVASLGFIPMALSHGAGAEVQRPLATVVIGGLITSTLLTLLVLPSAFRWMERDRDESSS